MSSTTITSLSVNQLKHPFGVERPSFGWKMQSEREGASQVAYRIRLFKGGDQSGRPVWDSGEVESGLSSCMPYGGPDLQSATSYIWRVAVKDDEGEWTESEPASFGTALMDAAAWAKSEWIAVAAPMRNDHDSSVFVHGVDNAKVVREAWWFVAGLGVFEAYVNGEPVSHRRDDGRVVRDALKPGFTHCGKRRHYFSYDVTHFVKTGAGETNTLTALVTGGWWRDQITGHRGAESAFRGVFVLRYSDGSEEIVGTGTDWMAAYAGPVFRADIFYGEDFDTRYDVDFRAWATGGKLGWFFAPARVSHDFKGELVPLKGLPIRQRDDIAIAPVSARVWSGVEGADDEHFGRIRVVREYNDGDEMKLYPGENLQFDFGQNAAAVPDFVFSARRDTRLTVRFSEMLNDGDGAFSRHNDGPEGELYKLNYRDARSEVHYIFVGKGDEAYRPQFTFFGYRYMSLSCSMGVVTIKRVRSVPVTSVTRCAETGDIETGVADLNRLIANGVWGQRSNYLSVPTDCPQRNERLGWAADTQVFTPTACYNANVYSFLNKWMDDMADSQHPAGEYPGVAPLAQYGDNGGAVGWADAGIIVPHVIWRMFGDTAVIKDHFASMTKYIDFIDGNEGPYPEPWGEWLAYERNDLELRKYLAAAFWVWDAQMMRRMAAAIGDKAAVARFEKSEATARASFKAKFIDDKGMIVESLRCQAADLYALYLDLVEGDAFEATKQDLLANIKAHDDCLQTGFLGTAIIMDTLTKVGATDVAYTLLLQHKNPSWLYSVDQGATTFWERWNSYTKESGFGDAGMNSFNHYAYGAVVSWMYSTMAGIAPDPKQTGFKHFILRPQPDKRVPSVKASFDSPYGVIESAWEYEKDGAWTWRYTIPANTTATVTLPNGQTFERSSGTYAATLAI